MGNAYTIAERFAIEADVAQGGMGKILRARDLATGAKVALKLVADPDPAALARFRREGEVLATIHHPGVVRYVDHGLIPGGPAYLAMEWLDGEDLASVLRRRMHEATRNTPVEVTTALLRRAGSSGNPATTADTTATGAHIPPRDPLPPQPMFEPMSVAEVLILGRRVAAALAALHNSGIVHRDIKPGNLFLHHGEIADIKLIDLGTAWLSAAHTTLTMPGHVIGTPSYMSPEQVRAGRAITPAVDMWALGCVLYVCLTGVKPFYAADIMAIFASIVLDVPRHVSELCSDVPAELTALVMQLLCKEPAERPSAADVAALLARIPAPPAALPRPASEAAPSIQLTDAEIRITSMVLVEAAAAKDPARMAEVARRYGGEPQRFLDGSMLITVPSTQDTNDQARIAARTALALASYAPEVKVVVATARTEQGAPVDTCKNSIVALRQVATPGVVRVDAITAALLESRIELGHDEHGTYLKPRRAAILARTVLGKAPTWVGRRVELATLSAAFEECTEYPRARVALITAPSGMGKSRLVHELLGRLRANGRTFELLSGRGDLVGTAPFGMLAMALRYSAGIAGPDPEEVKRRKLHERVARSVAPGDQLRISTLLGSMLGMQMVDANCTALRSVQADPIFYNELVQKAFIDFLRAELSREPVLLLLDDIQWGDPVSLRYIDHALAYLADTPLMVVALGRPEVNERFPQLFAKHGALELPLRPLPTKDCLALVRHFLGDEVPIEDAAVAHIVRNAEGNILWLEELIRAHASGRTFGMPETVLGVIQARLAELSAEARQILRAASVFGEVFWESGVAALIGRHSVYRIAEWLDELVRSELLIRQEPSRYPGEVEYRFAHATTRDSAYFMLTDRDRRVGHALAGEWLEQVGERDHLVMASHFHRGEVAAKAAWHYQQAAAQALAGHDLQGAIDYGERAIAAGARGDDVSEIRVLQAEAAFWLADYPACRRYGQDAFAASEPGSSRYFAAAGTVVVSSYRLGDSRGGAALAAAVAATPRLPGAEAKHIICLCRCAFQFLFDGEIERAEPILGRICAAIEALEQEDRGKDVRLTGQFCSLMGMYSLAKNQWDEVFRYVEQAIAAFEAAGDTRNMMNERASLAHVWSVVGDYRRAAAIAEENLLVIQRLGIKPEESKCASQLGYFLSRFDPPELARASELLTVGLNSHRQAGNRRMQGWTMALLSLNEQSAGNHERAAQLARDALAVLADSPSFLAFARAALALALLSLGRVAEALDHAWQAERSIGDARSRHVRHEGLIGLSLIKALEASGDAAGADAALARAAERLDQRASTMANPAWREMFFAIPEHREIRQRRMRQR